MGKSKWAVVLAAVVVLSACVVLTPVPALGAGGILYSPGGAREGSGIGLEAYRVAPDGTLRGGALWFAGSIAPEPDVDTTIPHSDYHTKSYDSRWGLLYLHGRETGKVTLIGGIGVAVVNTDYIDVSNVTGWSWDGGSDTTVESEVQLGLLIRIQERAGVRLGVDSQFGTFAGVAFAF